MNRKNGILAAAFFLGALTAVSALKLASAPVAEAQAMNPVVAARLNMLDKRLAVLENQTARGGGQAANTTTGPLHPGNTSVSTPAGQNAQINQDVVLQGEVDTLKTQFAKLQMQFASHYHTYTTESNPGLAHGVETILQCQGYGKPCTSASSLTEITVFVPPNVPPTAQTYTVQTSGPVQPSN
jgi:hypothetical protein